MHQPMPPMQIMPQMGQQPMMINTFPDRRQQQQQQVSLPSPRRCLLPPQEAC
jgi:hypothetical protein